MSYRLYFASAIVFVIGLSVMPATAGILDLDFTSDGSGNAGAFGGSPTPYGTAPLYTPFVVAELGPVIATTLTPSITVGPVSFTINGSINAWPGNNNNPAPDPLRGDYLFLGNGDGVLGVTPSPMPWTVAGLTANTSYVFTFVHGNNDGAFRSVKIDSGATTLTINGITGTHAGNLTVTSSATGTITGTFTGLQAEGNLAAMSLNKARSLGDVTGDNVANLADLSVISTNLFTQQLPYSNGDLDFNGFVDFADFRIWKGAAGSLAAGIAIPEPLVSVLVLQSTIAWVLVRRRGAK